MNAKRFWRPIVVAVGILSIALLSVTAYADDPTVPIPGCFRMGGVSVPAGAPVTFLIGWTMSTRGNTQSFANAASALMTVDGQAVTPSESDVFQNRPDTHPDGNADDPWRVQWTYATTAPAQAGQTMVVTANLLLSRQVADHELGSGQPIFLGPGLLFPRDFTCTLTAS
jgi:hypothetical protein